jgi:hypothetical protein
MMQEFRLHTTVLVLTILLIASVRAEAGSSLLFTRVPQSEANAEHVEKARQVMHSLYAKWQDGTFESVGDEFTPEMQKGLSPQLQKQSFEQIRSMLGDYQGITFVEALTARFLLPRGTIYRFKGTYSRTSEQPEIRVVFDSHGKISGLWLKPWHDELQ